MHHHLLWNVHVGCTHCPFTWSLLTSQQFSRIYFNKYLQYLHFSKKCILRMAVAQCAQNIMHSYLNAAKTRKPDTFLWPYRAQQPSAEVGGQRAVGLKYEINHPNIVLLQQWRVKTFPYGLIKSQMFLNRFNGLF